MTPKPGISSANPSYRRPTKGFVLPPLPQSSGHRTLVHQRSYWNRKSPPVSSAESPSVSSPVPSRCHPHRAAPGRTNPSSRNPYVSSAIPAMISRSPHETWLRRPSDRSGVGRRAWRRHPHHSLRQRQLRRQCRQE